MINPTIVPISEVELHLANHHSNIRFNNYGMPNCCPKEEIVCYKVILDENDTNRICLVGNFRNVTNNTGRLSDIDRLAVLVQETENRGKRVNDFLHGRNEGEAGIDLIGNNNFAPVLVGIDLNEGPLVLIDGSHRSIAQCIRNGSMQGVPAYICMHPNMINYGFYSDFLK